MPPPLGQTAQSPKIEPATQESATDRPSAIDLVQLGLQNAQMGQMKAAADVLAQAVIKDPLCADAYEALAMVLVNLGSMEFASKAKAKAVGLGYNAPADWEMLGDMFVALGQPDDAAQAFSTALALQPGSPELGQKLRAAAASQSAAADTQAFRRIGETARDAKAAALFGEEFLNKDAIPAAWRLVNLVTIEPAGNPHTAAFHDLTAGFESALKALGITVRVRKNEIGLEGVNLLFGGHLIASQEHADRVPHNTVIVNLEQLRGFNVAARPVYTSLMRRLAIWDYSPRNIAEIGVLMHNPYVCRFGIGYTPQMTRHLPAVAQTTDVLFYGSLNDRRNTILAALRHAGLKVRHLFSIYGDERDRAIADAKVVLNMHFYEDSIHEIVRTSFLLANAKAVVSECGPDTEMDDDIGEALVAVPYDGLVESCVALVKDEPRRRALERRALDVFSTRDQSAMLRQAILATKLPVLG